MPRLSASSRSRLQFRHVGLELLVLLLQLFQQIQDVVQLRELLHDPVAAVFLLGGKLLDPFDRVANAPVAHEPPVAVSSDNHHPPVHEATLGAVVRGRRSRLTLRSRRDLARLGPVLHQEGLDRLRAPAAQPLVVLFPAPVIGVSNQLHAIVAVGRQQIGQTQQARIAVAQDVGVELKVDLLPISGRRRRVEALPIQGASARKQQSKQNGPCASHRVHSWHRR